MSGMEVDDGLEDPQPQAVEEASLDVPSTSKETAKPKSSSSQEGSSIGLKIPKSPTISAGTCKSCLFGLIHYL